MTSTKDFEREVFSRVLKNTPELEFAFTEAALNEGTLALVNGAEAVCVFVTDQLNADCVERLESAGVKLIVLRSAGYNHVDVAAAKAAGIGVARVPKYSPQAVAEFTVGIYLCLNRKIHRAHDRVKEGNFSLSGLVGHDVYRQTIGVLGTGHIGKCVAQIFRGFGARVLAVDIAPDEVWAKNYGVKYTDWDQMLNSVDVLTLHVPLNKSTHHIVNREALQKLRSGAYFINTSRGALVDTHALIDALKSQRLAGAALDVYEEEEHYFFKDFSDKIVSDDVLARLMTFPNVLISSHQAFLTAEALEEIAVTSVKNILDWCNGRTTDRFL